MQKAIEDKIRPSLRNANLTIADFTDKWIPITF